LALYAFDAVRSSGEAVSAQLEAASEADAVERIREQGLILLRIQTAASAVVASHQTKSGTLARLLAPRKIKRDQIVSFTRDLANLISAGLPLDRAFELLVGLAESGPLATLLQDLRDRVRGGKSLSQALAEHPKHFDRLFVNMVRAGEASGTLGPVLERISEFQERSAELRSSVQSALMYPVVLVAVAVVAVLTMIFFVVPKFETTFRQFGKALPPATENLLALSHWVPLAYRTFDVTTVSWTLTVELAWYALAPLLLYAFFTVWKAAPEEKRILLWTAGFVLVWLLISSIRAGGDLWDNPRYRVTFIPFMALLAGWGVLRAWERRDWWLVRWLLVEIIFLGYFTNWYFSRYFHLWKRLPFWQNVLMISVLSAVVLGSGLLWDAGKGLYRRLREKEHGHPRAD